MWRFDIQYHAPNKYDQDHHSLYYNDETYQRLNINSRLHNAKLINDIVKNDRSCFDYNIINFLI